MTESYEHATINQSIGKLSLFFIILFSLFSCTFFDEQKNDLGFKIKIPSQAQFENVTKSQNSKTSYARNARIDTGDNVLLNAQIVDKSENIIQQKNINTTYNQEIIVEFQNVPVSTTNIAVKIQILKDDKTVFEGKSNYFVMNYSDVYVNVLLKSVSETFEISEIPEMVFVKGATINGADIPGIDSTATDEYKGVFISGRTVTLSDFYMSKYEITQAQYKAVMEGQTVTVFGEEKTLVVIKQSYNTFFQKFFQISSKYS